MEDIKDVKPLINLPPEFWWLWLLLGCAAIVAVAYWVFRHQRLSQPLPRPSPPPLPPWEAAYQQLEALRQKDLLAKGLLKDFFTTVCDIVRHYMEGRFNIRAPHMSTEEFLHYLKASGALNEGQKAALKDFLNSCDMVKFAKYAPTADEAWKNFDLAKKLVDDTRI